MLTPPHYWRIAKPLDELQEPPNSVLRIPSSLLGQKVPPAIGDGVLLADYDKDAQTGLVRFLGIVLEKLGDSVRMEWQPTTTEIWVDTPSGRGNWVSKAGFRFAATKVAGYGLHHLFSESFTELEPREALPSGARAIPSSRGSKIPRERLEPVQVVGEPSNSPRGGYIYVLKSAYGFKVGRTRNVPNRMRAFGVHLPIMYTIPLCAWYDDHIAAETHYHRLFAEKRINGEWFSLEDDDIELIRQRTLPT